MAKTIKYGSDAVYFSNEYVNGLMSFEEILRKVKEMGYDGIELMPPRWCPNIITHATSGLSG